MRERESTAGLLPRHRVTPLLMVMPAGAGRFRTRRASRTSEVELFRCADGLRGLAGRLVPSAHGSWPREGGGPAEERGEEQGEKGLQSRRRSQEDHHGLPNLQGVRRTCSTALLRPLLLTCEPVTRRLLLTCEPVLCRAQVQMINYKQMTEHYDCALSGRTQPNE